MIRTSSVLFWFGLIIAASLVLYRTSDRVQELNRQLRNTNASIEEEQQSIHVLKAEWVFLANPARIETMAKKHLSLRQTSPQQVASMSELQEMLPTRTEAMAEVKVSATPIASVKTSLAMAPQPAVVHIKPRAVKVASAAPSHINDHMMIQRTASAEPLPDSIGALLERLDQHP